MSDLGAGLPSQPFSSRPSGASTGSAPLRIDSFYPDEDTLVVTPAGEADIFNVPDLRRALIEATGTGRSHLIVDLDQLTFMDASTLGLLVAARLRISATGGTLQVKCRTRRNRRLLFMTGLEGMLDQRW